MCREEFWKKKQKKRQRCKITQWSKWRLVSRHAPWNVSLILSSFPFFFLGFGLKYTLLPALVCFLSACCLSCPKYFHLPLIIRPSRGAFHYTDIVSPHLFLLNRTGAARSKRLRISRKRQPLLKLCCTAVLPFRRNLKNLMTTSEGFNVLKTSQISNKPELSQKKKRLTQRNKHSVFSQYVTLPCVVSLWSHCQTQPWV